MQGERPGRSWTQSGWRGLEGAGSGCIMNSTSEQRASTARMSAPPALPARKDNAMCRMLYLGADRPLPLIMDDERFPGLWIDPLNPDAEDIIRILATMPFRYYVTTE